MSTKEKELIALNVGGTRFETSRQTLTKDGHSMLAKMFAEDASLSPAISTKDGEYFIDRNPERFKVILDYLRDGELSVDLSSKDVLSGLLLEARYFQLGDMELKVADSIVRAKGEETLRIKRIAEEVATCLQIKNLSSNLVKINVSGRIFQTEKATLCKGEDSVLAQMVEGTYERTKYDEQGNIFLNEDANAFATVLNFLRTYPQGIFCDYSDDLPLGFGTQLARKLKLIEHGQFILIDMP
jgi:hypothetical protein